MHPTREAILDFVFSYLEPYPPSQQEIALAVNLSVPAVSKHIHILADMGYIVHKHRSPRSIELILDKYFAYKRRKQVRSIA